MKKITLPRSLASLFVVVGSVTTVMQPALAQTSTDALRPAVAASTPTSAPKELVVIERKIGEGPAVATNDPINVHYAGYLWDPAAPLQKGKKFDSSIEKVAPIGFIVGAGRVIKGWDEGVIGMQVGGQRTLVIPAEKAYAEKGSPPSIPPNAALVFDIELMSIIGKTKNPIANPSPFVPPKETK
jgi:FKBP-type peptidyl-prolyl cis-trans isomerase FkpA